MAERKSDNWERLEPPLAELDRDLHEAMRGPQPRGELAERIFEATADDVLAGGMKTPLRSAMAVEAPAGLADRVARATQQQVAREATHRRRWMLQPIGSIAVAAMLLLGVGLAVHFASIDPDVTSGPTQPGGNASVDPAEAGEVTDIFENLEWALASNDEIHSQVSALAADIDDFNHLADMESDAAIENELTRQFYYYELADAQAASF